MKQHWLLFFVSMTIASALAEVGVVQVEGVLRQVDSEGKRTIRLILEGESGSSVVRVQGDKDVWRRKIDSLITCKGERKDIYNPRGEVVGHYLESSLADVEVLNAGSSARPLEAPEVPLGDIWNKSAKPGHLRCVTGTVTWAHPELGFYLQQGDDAVFVSTRSKEPVIPGSVMKVSGFARMENCVGTIQAHKFIRIGTAPLPPASEVPCKELWEYSYRKERGRTWDAMPVVVTGRITRADVTGKRKNVFIAEDDEGKRFFIVLRGEMSESMQLDFEDRPLVKVSGVCHLAFSPSSMDSRLPRISHVEVLVRSMDDIEILPDAAFPVGCGGGGSGSPWDGSSRGRWPCSPF